MEEDKDKVERYVKSVSPAQQHPLKDTSPGRQLFEKNRDLATSDASYIEEGVTSVDITAYDRTGPREEDEDEGGLHFSDSD